MSTITETLAQFINSGKSPEPLRRILMNSLFTLKGCPDFIDFGDLAGSMVQLRSQQGWAKGERYCTVHTFRLCLYSTGIIQTHNLLTICSQFLKRF